MSVDQVPPPSAALRSLTTKPAPVRTRKPALMFASVAALAIALVAFVFYVHPLRGDLADQPRFIFVAVGLAWLAAFLGALAVAMLPPRRQVLPDAGRAARVAALACIIILVAVAVGTVTVPSSTVPKPDEWWHRAGDCIAFELKVWAVAFLITFIALWRVRPRGAWRIGAAIGVAGASLGGLALHLLCPFSTTAHVLVAHGGTVVLAGLLGALLAALRR